jgi:5-hydroxyisourate hydrolase
MNAGGISIHAVDVAHGRPAEGLSVEVHALEPARRLIAEGRLGANGLLDHPIAKGEGIVCGSYEAVFHIGAYFAASGLGGSAFLDAVPFRFVVARPEEHYHLPLKFTPFGFSLFRGF